MGRVHSTSCRAYGTIELEFGDVVQVQVQLLRGVLSGYKCKSVQKITPITLKLYMW